MKRKHWLIALIIAMLTCMALFIAACGGGDDEEKKDGGDGGDTTIEVTIALDKSSLQLEEWQSATLVATKTGTTETVTWASSDDEIASVNGVGVVHGNKKGNATITASVAGKSATCAVTVTESGVQPTLTLTNIIGGELSISNLPDEAFTVTTEVSWDGEKLDGAKFTWTSDDEEIATVEKIDDGYSAVITGIKKGQTTIRVTAEIRSKTAIQTFPVTVTASGIILQFGNEDYKASESGYTATLVAVGEGNTTTPVVNALEGGVPSTVSPTWALKEGGDVVDLNEATGQITAKKYGTAVVEGTYEYEEEDYTITLHVVVERLEVPVSHSSIIAINRASSAPVIDLAANEIDAELYVNGVKADSQHITIDAQKATLKVEAFDVKDADGLSDKREKVSVHLDTDFRSYTFEAQVVDYLIGTAEELGAIYNPAAIKSANPNATAPDKTGMLYGTNIIMLDNDIVATDYSGNIGFDDYNEFNGIIDGQGHTIYGLRAGWSGLFQNIGANGVVKNIAFVGLTFTKSAVIFGNRMYGTLENCYFEGAGNSGDTANTTLANIIEPTTVIKNVVVNIHDRTGAADAYAVIRLVRGYKEISGLYVVVTESNGQMNNPETAGIDLNDADVHYYASAAAFKNAVKSLPAGFSSDRWTMYDGYLIFKSAVEGDGSILSKIEEKLDAITLRVAPMTQAYINQPLELSVTTTPSGLTYKLTVENLGNNEYTLNGNTFTLTSNAPVGSTFSIIASYYENTVGHYYESRVDGIEIRPEPQRIEKLDDVVVGLNRLNGWAAATDAGVSATEGKDFAITLPASDAVTAVSVGGNSLGASLYAQSGTTLKLKSGSFTATGEKIAVQVDTATVSYQLNARVVDYTIADVNELKGLWNRTTAPIVFDSDAVILLEADIDASSWKNAGYNISVYQATFLGTFDGQNHTISNITASFHGLFFHYLGETGVIKNIAFTGIKFNNNPTIFGDIVYGTIENCYFEGSGGAASASGTLCNRIGPNATIKNVVVYLHETTNTYGVFQSLQTGNPDISGLYAINPNATSGKAYNDSSTSLSASFTHADEIHYYTSLAAFKSAVTSRPDAISQDFWNYLQSMS